ncbi:MAG: asparagine synthase-related protein [Candidatus Paceibacteria bacterium]
MDGSVFTERVFANGEQGGSGNLVDKMTRWDFRNYLVDDILTKVDRASMAVSLEVRAPFLDREIVNFAFRDVPSSLKCDGKEKKILPKLLANRLLPEDLDTDRKQGFSIPLDDWLEGAWGNYCSRILADAPNSLFDQGELSKLMRGQSYGLSNSSRIFALTMFELWRRHYDINI